MKSMKQIFFITLSTMLILTSCTMEKRVYMSGYHTEWYKSKHTPDRQGSANNNNETITKLNKNLTIDESASETNTVENTFIQPVIDDNISASVDNNMIIIPSHKPVAFDEKVIAIETTPASDTKTEIPTKKALKSNLKELKADTSSGDEAGHKALRVIGWIVVALGLLILLIASIIAGALLMLLGLVFIIVGRKKGDTSAESKNKSDNSRQVDVIYLKNGSVIKGMITEQIPNVSIKIQTKDGSIFIYKMEEIEKMGKEVSK